MTGWILAAGVVPTLALAGFDVAPESGFLVRFITVSQTKNCSEGNAAVF